MKRILLTTALAMTATAAHANSDFGVHSQATLTAHELVVTLDNVAEEAGELSAQAARRGHQADAKAFANVADDAENLANHIDQRLLTPLEQDAPLAYAKAQLSRLAMDFDLLDYDLSDLDRTSAYLDAELDNAAELRYELQDILSSSDRGRPGRDSSLLR